MDDFKVNCVLNPYGRTPVGRRRNTKESKSKVQHHVGQRDSVLALTGASVPVICELITTPALTPVASQQVDTHGVGATAMEASCALIYI